MEIFRELFCRIFNVSIVLFLNVAPFRVVQALVKMCVTHARTFHNVRDITHRPSDRSNCAWLWIGMCVNRAQGGWKVRDLTDKEHPKCAIFGFLSRRYVRVGPALLDSLYCTIQLDSIAIYDST